MQISLFLVHWTILLAFVFIVSCLRDVTQDFMDSKNITLDKNGFIATINQSALENKLMTYMTLPTGQNDIILITNINSTTNVKKPPKCGYIKLGIFVSIVQGKTILKEGVFEWDFSKDNENVSFSAMKAETKQNLMVMKYENSIVCRESYSTVLIISGIFAYQPKFNSCNDNDYYTPIKEKALCIPQSIREDDLAVKRLALINVDLPEDEKGFTTSQIIIIISILSFTFVALICLCCYENRKKILNNFRCANKTDKNDNPKRGLCLIIANDKFSNENDLPERKSVKQDFELIQKVFTKFNFQLETYKNQTVEEMQSIMKRISFKPDYDSFFLFILSHGSSGHIFGKYGEETEAHELVDLLQRNCVNLEGKPKFIFVIGCSADSHRKEEKNLTFPNEDDMLIAYATTAQNYSQNMAERPTFFINKLCSLIEENPSGNLRQLVRNARDKTSKMIKRENLDEDLKPVYITTISADFRLTPQQINIPVSESNESEIFYELRHHGGKRGLCLIIANDKFSNENDLPERKSVKQDFELIQKVFTKFNFQLETYKNQTVEEMQSIMKRISFKPDYDSFFLFILSHGSSGHIFGKYGEETEAHELVDLLQRNCDNLEGKPKFIFAIGCSEIHRMKMNRITYPNGKDKLVVFATTAQNPEIKKGEMPTFFLKHLCDSMERNSNENFETLVRKACDDTSNMIKRGPNKNKDLKPFYVSKLSKSFRMSIELTNCEQT